MGIQPVDLQAIYSQLDKVAKTQIQQTQGQQIQTAMQHDVEKKKLLKKKSSVEEAEKLSDGISALKERQKSNQDAADSEEKEDLPKEEEKKAKTDFFSDPDLGQHIDVSG